MKRIILLFCSIVFATCLFACQDKDDLSVALLALSQLELADITGYDLKIEQYSSGTLTNADTMTYRSDLTMSPKYFLISDRVRLEHFGDQFSSTSSQTLYFFEGELGLQHNEDAVEWKVGTLEQFQEHLFVPPTIKQSQLEGIVQSSSEELYKLEATLSQAVLTELFDDGLDSLLTTAIKAVERAKLTLTLDKTQKTLTRLELTLTSTITTTTLAFCPLYTQSQVIIPAK